MYPAGPKHTSRACHEPHACCARNVKCGRADKVRAQSKKGQHPWAKYSTSLYAWAGEGHGLRLQPGPVHESLRRLSGKLIRNNGRARKFKMGDVNSSQKAFFPLPPFVHTRRTFVVLSRRRTVATIVSTRLRVEHISFQSSSKVDQVWPPTCMAASEGSSPRAPPLNQMSAYRRHGAAENPTKIVR